MSSIRNKIVRCPKCGRENEFLIYESVNVTHDNDLKTKVLNQSIFKYTCECGCKTHVFYPVLYHDMDKSYMVQFCSNDKRDEYISNFKEASKLASGYKYRIVDKPYEITEKVLIFDAGYDDKLMEILKEMIMASKNDPNIDCLLFSKSKDGEYSFICLDAKNNAIAMVPFKEELYKSVSDMFKVHTDPIGDNYIIDQEWSREFLCEVKL